MEDIVEVEECGIKNANAYLSAGYRLLSIAHTSREAKSARGTEERPEFYVRRSIIYVLGRTAAIPRADRREIESGQAVPV